MFSFVHGSAGTEEAVGQLLLCLPGVNLDVRLGVEFLRTEPALEAVGRHLVGLVHVGLQLGRRIFLNKREEGLKSTCNDACSSQTRYRYPL